MTESWRLTGRQRQITRTTVTTMSPPVAECAISSPLRTNMGLGCHSVCCADRAEGFKYASEALVGGSRHDEAHHHSRVAGCFTW
jgi:hypothetical protein